MAGIKPPLRGKKETMEDGLAEIAKDFHDDIQRGLGPGESVEISSGGKTAKIEGKSNSGDTKKVVRKLASNLKKVK
jgi:hypothetical protein